MNIYTGVQNYTPPETIPYLRGVQNLINLSHSRMLLTRTDHADKTAF